MGTVSIEQKLNREISQLVKHHAKNFDSYCSSDDDVTYFNFFENKLLIICVIQVGVPYSLFSLIQAYTPFSEKDWSTFLDLSPKSLHRYKQNPKTFKPIHSEKIIELAEVTNIGIDVFGDVDKFKFWLETPNFSLGGLKPMDLLKDSYGKEMVVSELTRINYGILV